MRSATPDSEILGHAKGAFVNVVTWASDPEGYRINVELIAGKLGVFVAGIEDAEPVEAWRKKLSGEFSPELEDIIARARANPNAIIYSTFHRYKKDSA